MATSASGSRSGRMSEMQVTKAFRSHQDLSPDRNKVWLQKPKPDPRVPVVYYLSRNGQLEHPHFIQVPLSSPHGLFLRDVISRLDVLRGKGMAALYSWSCKRSYKNGFVWHDLSEDDFIYPAHGREYVLKGSLLPPRQEETAEIQIAAPVDLDYPAAGHSRRRNQSCSSIDFSLDEYSVYKTEPSCRSAAADASTQTDDIRRRRRRQTPEIVEEKIEKTCEKEPAGDEIEISISPPPSDSSPETLEKLMKAEGRSILRPETANEGSSAAAGGCGGKIQRPAVPSGRSSVLMQLITCGSISFKDCSAGHGLISQYKMRAPRGGGGSRVVSGGVGPKLEDKEYFSGSLVETKKEEFPALKRSNSYNADR